MSMRACAHVRKVFVWMHVGSCERSMRTQVSQVYVHELGINLLTIASNFSLFVPDSVSML